MINTNLALDLHWVNDENLNSQRYAQTYTNNDTACQRWRIVKNYTSFSNADGTYRIMSCLKANYGFVLNGGTIQVWDYAVRDIRRWKFDPAKTTYYNTGHTNGSYNRTNVKTFAETYAMYTNTKYDTPNYLLTGDNNCTNFVSRCILDGGLNEITNYGRTDDRQWRYGELLGKYYASYTWGGAENFARHWGHNGEGVGNQRAYLTIVYPNAQTALNDWGFIYGNMYNGDIIQLYNPTDKVHHSMVIHTALINGTSDMLYAQHTGGGKDKSVQDLLTRYLNNSSEKFIFHRINS